MQPSASNTAVKIVLPNILGYERIAMACSASFAQLNGLPPDRIEDLKTIVAEATTNAMQHGNRGRSDAKIKVSLECNQSALVVKVTDEVTGESITKDVPCAVR